MAKRMIHLTGRRRDIIPIWRVESQLGGFLIFDLTRTSYFGGHVYPEKGIHEPLAVQVAYVLPADAATGDWHRSTPSLMVLIVSGMVIGMYVPSPASLGAWVAAALLFGFVFGGRRVATFTLTVS